MDPGDSGGGEGGFSDWLQATFSFNIWKAEQTGRLCRTSQAGFEPPLGLFSSVLFGKLAIQRSASSGLCSLRHEFG